MLTGGGGWHYLFRHPGADVRNSVGRLGAGLDIRGDGGYVIAAPSIHVSGRPYKWTRALAQSPPAELPTWLLADAAARIWLEPLRLVEEVIPEGKARITALACRDHAPTRGLGADEILAALEAVNLARCKPQLAAAELRALADDVADRWSPNPAASLRVAKSNGVVAAVPARPGGLRSCISIHGIAWQRLSEVGMRSIVFVDKPLLQTDALHLLVGRKGQGKGTARRGRVTHHSRRTPG